MASLNLQDNFIQSIIESLSQSINPDNEKRRVAYLIVHCKDFLKASNLAFLVSFARLLSSDH